MTCPVTHAPPRPETVTSTVSALPPVVGTAGETSAATRFAQFGGTVFPGLFATALFDQAMLPAVSAALEDTGRIRNTPFSRALRTAVSAEIIFAGDEADRQVEAQRLKQLHRDVKGVGGDGVRYSAMHPESWNWIMISTFFMQHGAYVAVTGDRLTAADSQAVWDWYRQMVEGLQLPGRSRLVESYPELCEYYDRMVEEKLESTVTLDNVVDLVRHPPMPEGVPGIVAPAWTIAGALVGHVSGVLGYGIMHPGVRALTTRRWTKRDDLEFTVLTTLLGITYRWLPQTITETPLTRNRRKYARIMNRNNRLGLISFAADHPTPSR